MNSYQRVRAFQIELEFGSVGFWGKGKTGVPWEKPLGAKERTSNKLNPYMAQTPGFEPGPHWREASALITAPPLLSLHFMGHPHPSLARFCLNTSISHFVLIWTEFYFKLSYTTVEIHPAFNILVTMELLIWRLHGQPLQRNHLYLAYTSLLVQQFAIFTFPFCFRC